MNGIFLRRPQEEQLNQQLTLYLVELLLQSPLSFEDAICETYEEDTLLLKGLTWWRYDEKSGFEFGIRITFAFGNAMGQRP